jgi:hypothetical protein
VYPIQKSRFFHREEKKVIISQFFIILVFIFLITATVTGAEEKSTILTAQRINESITIDGYANESSWSRISIFTTRLKDGSIGEVDVGLQALYDTEYIYIHATWPDPTESVNKKLWTFNGTEWLKSGDEDRLAIFWNIGDSVEGFNIGGCAMLCHGDRMHTNAPDEKADSWHWKASRTNPAGYMDDKFVDDTTVDYTGSLDTAIDITARHPDPKESGGYSRNGDDDETRPIYFEPNPTDHEDGIFIFKTEFDDGQAIEITDEMVFSAGDTIPGYILEKPVGSRGDIEARGVWEDGIWSLEIKRKLNTGHDDDVQFDTTRTYRFGVAVMDNSGGFAGFGKGHSFDLGARTLEFGGKGSKEITELVLVRDYLITAKAYVNRDESGLSLSSVSDALVIFNRIRDSIAEVDPELFINIRNSFVDSRRNPSLENVDALIENIDIAILTLQGKREPPEATLWLKILVLWGRYGIYAFVALSIIVLYPIYRMISIIKKPQFRNLGLFMLIIIAPLLLEGVGRLSAIFKIPLLQNFSFTTSESVTIFWVAAMYLAIYLGRIGFNEIDHLFKSLERSKEDLETRVNERTSDLQQNIDELEKWQRLTVGRELKMSELKNELNELKEKLKKSESD